MNTRNTELFHYGVKGMKWGVRRKGNEHNKNYTDKQRKNDRAMYGDRAEKRINRKLNEGYGLRGARHFEVERRERKEKEATNYVKKIRKDWINIHNSAADVDDRNLKALNKKYDGVDFKKNKKAYRRYVDEYVSMWNNELLSEVTKRYGNRPELLSDEAILSNLPTRITESGAQSLYDSMYE